MKWVPHLELADARQLADAALQAARGQGLNVSVAVSDVAGRLVVFLRDDAASGASIELAPAKARTSALLGMPSRHLEKAANQQPALATMPGIALLGGAVDLRCEGALVGAIAVSGGPSGEVDEMLARTGIEAWQRGLAEAAAARSA